MQRSRYVVLAIALVVVIAGGALIATALHRKGDSGSGLTTTSSTQKSTSGAKASPSGPSAADLAKAKWAADSKKLDTALATVAASAPDFSVAVLDKNTGEKYSYRGTATYDTASIVKAQILACTLLKDQDAGHGITSGEKALATPMIHLSDNNAATSLFQHVGARSGVQACDKRLGLTHTVVNSAWGLTKTTANDQIKLLSEFVDTSGPLNATSRKTVFGLMSTVNSAQRWGVPSIAKTGETATNKNGWDTRTADGGLWVINTIGRVTDSDGDVNVSVAVLSHDNQSMDSGVDLVEKVAKLTRQYLAY